MCIREGDTVLVKLEKGRLIIEPKWMVDHPTETLASLGAPKEMVTEPEELEEKIRKYRSRAQELRKKTGLVPGGRAIAVIEENKLIVSPKPTALTLLKKPRVNTKPISPQELSQLRREIVEEIETM